MSESGEQLVDRAVPFRRIAEKIDTNRDNDFAGAFVIVPPEGDVHSMLLLDADANAAIFWSTLKTRVDIALAEIDQAERQGSFGGRR